MKSKLKKRLVTVVVLVSIFSTMIPVNAEEIYAISDKSPSADVAESPEGYGPASSAPGDTILDTPEVIAEMEKARALAGEDESLKITQVLQSRDVDENGVPSGPPGVNTVEGSEEHTETDAAFDNLYYVGGTEVGCFIFVTTEGYIMIDSGYTYMPEDYIIPDMEKLGLNPSLVKYILITHSGPDHIGGSSYFKENYGTQVLQSRADLVSLEEELSLQSTENVSVGINEDDMSLTLGDTTITIVETPRKVDGGGLSYIAPVFDNGEAHMWATYGNTGAVGTLEDKVVYRESVAKFIKYVEAYDVDVVISNHPFVDGSLSKMEELRNRQPGDANPFVFGVDRVVRFFEVLDQCCVVLATRQEAGLDETGTKLLSQDEASTEPSGESPSTAPATNESQGEETTAVSLDTPEIKAAVQVAIDIAGDNESLLMTQRQQCKSTTYRGEKIAVEPIQLFDNLYLYWNG